MATSPKRSNILLQLGKTRQEHPASMAPYTRNLPSKLIAERAYPRNQWKRCTSCHLVASTTLLKAIWIVRDEGETNNDPVHDYQLIEDNQLLITGFDRCVESKMATLISTSEASSSADAPSLVTRKKKGKKLKKAKGL
ncbi:hypothetical protein NC653_026592 [Populus alba x Populus x berolinensis]|uniref:Uncharacterized protein n=1 Tax=Populus alba x Populus x berolinensis TaxID=444605 RepID=A0AAD6QAH4_9ROSI|nr:hypothetical protein NC653_026592 [Populus alba x Populus x berolinensis]